MIAAFIQKRGVTPCPPCGSKELAEFNRQRDLEFQQTGGWGARGQQNRWRRKRGLA